MPRAAPLAAVSQQLSLNLRLKDASSFGNFLAGPNREAMEQLRAAVVQAATQANAKPAMIYLWGAEGAGKQTFELNMVEILERGQTENDVVLQPDDFIIVPSRLINF